MFAAGMAVGARGFSFLAVCRQNVDNFTRTTNDIVNATIPPVKLSSYSAVQVGAR
jgi:hypothetical protein